ncbi:MAG TPA: hypothetical protein VK717_03275 [Opitutaceae bacterium]|jgi:hypothetical protein|nr:hypothetical protein [Opitutaceae bacterium]
MRLISHRLALAASLLSLLCLVPARAADVALVRVWPGYRTTESFERISEYFTGNENTGGQTMLRSQPAERMGFYFLVRLKNSGATVTGATFELSVITPASATPHLFTFTGDLPAGEHVFNLGLTGADWPGAKTEPVAWKLTVLAPDHAGLTSAQSFLWDKPPGQN